MKKTIALSLTLFSIAFSQTSQAQTKSQKLAPKKSYGQMKVDSLNKLIADTLIVKEKYLKAGKDTMDYANKENTRLTDLTSKDGNFLSSEKGQKMYYSIYNAQQAKNKLDIKAFEVDMAVKDLQYQIGKIKGNTAAPKLGGGVTKKPVNVDQKSGTITF